MFVKVAHKPDNQPGRSLYHCRVATARFALHLDKHDNSSEDCQTDSSRAFRRCLLSCPCTNVAAHQRVARQIEGSSLASQLSSFRELFGKVVNDVVQDEVGWLSKGVKGAIVTIILLR